MFAISAELSQMWRCGITANAPNLRTNAVIRMRVSADMRQGGAVRVTGDVDAPLPGWESAVFISGSVLLKLFI